MHLLRDKPAGRFSPGCLFRPNSVAVIGAESQVGRQVLANLRAGGFKGALPRPMALTDIAALPAAPDLAVFATPPTPELLAALAAKGTFAAVVVCGADGLADPARRGRVRVLGPESFGIAVPSIGLNASRAHLPVPAGRLGLVSQSASLCRTVLDWAQPNGVGFSHIVGIGGRADIGFGLVLDWMSRDPGTGAILLDIRQLREPPRLPVRRTRRLPAAAGGGDPPRHPAGGPQRRGGTRLRGGAAARRRAVRHQPRGPADRRRDPGPRAPGAQRDAGIVTNAIGRRPDGRRCGAARRAAAGVAKSCTWSRTKSARLAELATSASAAPGVGGVLVVHAPTGDAGQTAIASLAACRDR